MFFYVRPLCGQKNMMYCEAKYICEMLSPNIARLPTVRSHLQCVWWVYVTSRLYAACRAALIYITFVDISSSYQRYCTRCLPSWCGIRTARFQCCSAEAFLSIFRYRSVVYVRERLFNRYIYIGFLLEEIISLFS